jgi:hypothetical protein
MINFLVGISYLFRISFIFTTLDITILSEQLLLRSFLRKQVAQDVQPVVHDTNRLVPDGVDEYQYLRILDR